MTTIAPLYTLANCGNQITYSCTQTSVGKTSDLCTKNDADYSTFDPLTGELQMLSNYAKRHEPGTYDISFTVDDGSGN